MGVSEKMKVAIVGAGFTGLSAAWQLCKAGHQVTIFEASDRAGGLSAGFSQDNWNWSLEKHYHHVFTSDKDFKALVEELNLSDQLRYRSVKSSTRINGFNYQLDTPLSLLLFPKLSLLSRLRIGITTVALKLIDDGEFLERYTAKEFIIKTMGWQAWQVIWQPLFKSKFDQEADQINMAWFWSRVKYRSAKLGYFEGGFQFFINKLIARLKEKEVKIFFNQKIDNTEKLKKEFDKILLTYTNAFPSSNLAGLAAMTIVMELKQPFLNENIYWLNINEKDWPFVAVIEHTHMIEKDKYADHSIVYLGRYLAKTSKFFQLNKDQVFTQYKKYLNKINPEFEKNLVKTWLFKDEFAQPIVKVNHSKLLPSITTNDSQIFWACMQHIYPFDRQINNAVKLGKKAVQVFCQSK